EVLQYQDERLSRRHPGQGPRQQFEDLDPIFRFALRRRRCDAGVPARRGAQLADFGQKGEEREEVGRDVREIRALRGGASRVARAEVVLNQFAETLVRERLVLLDEPAVEDADLAHGDELLQLLEEPRLADPRLSRYDGKLAVAGERGVQATLELGELLLAPHEGGGRRALERAARIQDHRPGELVAVKARTVALERLRELPRSLGPPRRILLEALQDDVLQ